MVGGRKFSCSASVQITASVAPAAPSMCPVIDLVEETGILYARSSPNTSFRTRVSDASPTGVEVPCALM